MWYVCDNHVVHVGQTREGNPIVKFIAVTQLQVAQGKITFHQQVHVIPVCCACDTGAVCT